MFVPIAVQITKAFLSCLLNSLLANLAAPSLSVVIGDYNDPSYERTWLTTSSFEQTLLQIQIVYDINPTPISFKARRANAQKTHVSHTYKNPLQ